MVKKDKTSRRILIAYDGSGYSHAILCELQRVGLPQKARVILISVSEIFLPMKYPLSERFPDNDVADYAKKKCEQAARNVTEANSIVCEAREELLKYFPGWDIQTEVLSGSPVREVLSRSLEFRPDLIVVGAQGLSSDGETGLGSVSQNILNAAKCSVRISRPSSNDHNFRSKIIIGFDASEGSMAAVKTVALRQWATKPVIRLVTITDPFILLNPGRVLLPVPGLSEGLSQGEQKWVQMRATGALNILLDAGHSATLHRYSGNPKIILPREAEKWKATSVFIGSNSPQNPSDLSSLGCVASAVASRSGCSVEVVRLQSGE